MAEKQGACIGRYLDSLFDELHLRIKQQLIEKKDIIINYVNDRVIQSDEHGAEIFKELFGDILGAMHENYENFAEHVSLDLAWEVFCGKKPSGISVWLIREAQLGVWNRLREKGFLLSLGKLVAGCYKELKRGTAFGAGLQDMIDSEGLTLAILEGVVFVTYDSPDDLEARIYITNQVISQLEQVLSCVIPRRPGRVICISRPSNVELVKVLETLPTIHL
jgi:hypothetical protein